MFSTEFSAHSAFLQLLCFTAKLRSVNSPKAAASSKPLRLRRLQLLFPAALILLVSIIIGFFVLSTLSQSQSAIKKQTFDAAQLEAKAFGQRFHQLIHHNLDLLGTVFQSSTDGVTDRILSAVPDALGAVYGSIDPRTKLIIRTSRSLAKTEALARAKVMSSEINLTDSAIAPLLNTLPENKSVFFRFPNENKKPLIAIAKLTGQPPGQDGFIPFAFAIFSAHSFAEEKTSAALTLLFNEAKVLLSTDFNSDYDQNLAEFKDVIGSKSSLTHWIETPKADDVLLQGLVPIDSSLSVAFRTKGSVVLKRNTDLLAKTLLVGAIFMIIAASGAVYFSRNVFQRIVRITQSLSAALASKPVDPLSTAENDEISQLAAEVNRVPEFLGSLKDKHRNEFRSESEKIISAAVQQTLIPPDKFKSAVISIRSHYQPASEFSGDWWGFFGVGQRLCILIGDCTGRGFQSALMTAAVRSCFSVMHKLAVENEEFSYSPGAMLSYANRSVFDTSSGRAAMTLFASVIDFSTGRMTYSSAGHNPPWLFKKAADGSFTSVSLVSRGQRLGEARNVPDFHEEALQISKGDILFLYTDGLIDTLGPAGERFGKMKTRKAVEEGLSKGPEAVVTRLKNDLKQFSQGVHPDDDITFACVEFLPDGKTS